MAETRPDCVGEFTRWIRDPCPSQSAVDFGRPFVAQRPWLCRAVLQGRYPAPEGMEAKVQRRVLCPAEGVVLMPIGRAIPVLIYGMCAHVAKQHGSVNISFANPVDICLAVKVCNIKLIVEETLMWNSTSCSRWDFKGSFSLASHSRKALMKCDLIELP